MRSHTSIIQSQELQLGSEPQEVFSLVVEEKEPRVRLTDCRDPSYASEGCSQ